MDPESFCYYPPPPTESIRVKLGLPPQMDVGPYAYAIVYGYICLEKFKVCIFCPGLVQKLFVHVEKCMQSPYPVVYRSSLEIFRIAEEEKSGEIVKEMHANYNCNTLECVSIICVSIIAIIIIINLFLYSTVSFLSSKRFT